MLRHLETRDLSNDGGVGCEDEETHSPPPAAAEEVHLGTVRVAAFRVDQLVVSDVIRPTPDNEGEQEEADPELPFKEASSKTEKDAAIEAAPQVEEPLAPEVEEPSSEAEVVESSDAAPPIEEPLPPEHEEPSSEAEEDIAPGATAPVEEAFPHENEGPSLPPQEPVRRMIVNDFMSDSSDTDFWDMAARPPEPKPEPEVDPDPPQGEDALPGAVAGDIPLFQSVAEDEYYEDTSGFQELDEGVASIAPLDEEAQPEVHDGHEKTGRFLSVFSGAGSRPHPRSSLSRRKRAAACR